MSNTVPSTSDQRVVNNVMRHNYRVLSEAEKLQMQTLKDKGLEFIEYLKLIGGYPAAEGQTTYELFEAQKRMEEAVMWAVKHVTR